MLSSGVCLQVTVISRQCAYAHLHMIQGSPKVQTLEDADAYSKHHQPCDSEAHSTTGSSLGPKVTKSLGVLSHTHYEAFGIFRCPRLCALARVLQHYA